MNIIEGYQQAADHLLARAEDELSILRRFPGVRETEVGEVLRDLSLARQNYEAMTRLVDDTLAYLPYYAVFERQVGSALIAAQSAIWRHSPAMTIPEERWYPPLVAALHARVAATPLAFIQHVLGEEAAGGLEQALATARSVVFGRDL